MFCWMELIFEKGEVTTFFGGNLLVWLKQGCILNLVEFGCAGAEKKVGVSLVWFVVWFVVSSENKAYPTLG